MASTKPSLRGEDTPLRVAASMPLFDPSDPPIGTTTAARLVGVSEARIRQVAAAGLLPSQATELGRLFRRGDVEAFADARRRRATQPPAA